MITGAFDKLFAVKPGDVISAEQYNLLRRLVARNTVASNSFVNSSGAHIRDKVQSAGLVSFCSVRASILPDDVQTTVPVHEVKYDDGVYIINTAFVYVQCWPGHIRGDYYPLATTDTGVISEETQVCGLRKVYGIWHCEPFSKRDRKRIEVYDRIRLSDCQIVTE